MHSAKDSFAKRNRKYDRDFDFAMLCEILAFIDGQSAVKLACNPTAADGSWIHGSAHWDVSKVTLDNKGRLVLCARSSKPCTTVGQLADQIEALDAKPAPSTAVVARVHDDDIEITDAYLHLLVKDHWAGVPFDLVLAYYNPDTRPAAAPEDEEPAGEEKL